MIVIEGALTARQDGLHGLTVTAHAGSRTAKSPSASTLTNAQGQYRIELDSKARSVSLSILDRFGDEITCTQKLDAREQPVRFDLCLDDKAVAAHLSKPTSWERPPQAPLGEDALAAISSAAAALGAGPATVSELNRAWTDAQAYSALAADAWDAVAGNPAALVRTRRRLVSLGALRDQRAPRRAESGEPRADVAPHRTSPALLGQLIPWLLASGMSARDGDERSALLDLVLDETCQLVWLDGMAVAAAGSLRGDEADSALFEGMLGAAGVPPEPPGGFSPNEPLPPRRPPRSCFMPGFDDCLLRTIELSERAVPEYTIESVSPTRACPGEQIQLQGHGFGTVPHPIRFARYGQPNRFIEVPADSWSDTLIVVTVPDGAGCGVSIGPIFVDTLPACGRFIDQYRPGTILQDFEGTSPEIRSFTVNGEREMLAVQPGETLVFRWDVCAADHVRFELRDEQGKLIVGIDPAAQTGKFSFTATQVDVTTHVIASLLAEGNCDPPNAQEHIDIWIQEPPNLSIDGIEVTQATQFYHSDQHLTDPLDQEPDNNIPLVAERSAWVRVYLRSGQLQAFDDGALPGINGTLTVERFVGGSWVELAVLDPVQGDLPAYADLDYVIERTALDGTLNFVLDPELVDGALKLTASVDTPFARWGNGTATSVLGVSAVHHNKLKLAFIGVGYLPRPGGGGAFEPAGVFPPRLSDLMRVASRSWGMFPVADELEFRDVGSILVSDPLTNIAAAGQSSSIEALFSSIGALRAADGDRDDWIYAVLVDGDVPRRPDVPGGLGADGTAVVFNSLMAFTLAHEVGHAAGLDHAPCGGASGPDPNFPAYEPHDPPSIPTASIGEFGLIMELPFVAPPTGSPLWPRTGFKDFMGYCVFQWISPYHYRRLLESARLGAPQLGGGGPGGLPSPRSEPFDALVLGGSIKPQGELRIGSVVRVNARDPGPGWSPTNMIAELIDDDGNSAAAARVFRQPMRAHDVDGHGSDSVAVLAVLPDACLGSEIRIRDGETVVWSRSRPKREPKITDLAAKVDEDGTMRLSWKTNAGDAEAPKIWVQVSADDGAHWQSVLVSDADTEARFDRRTIPGGSVAIRALLHDGFSSAASEPVGLDLEPLPPLAVIAHPEDGSAMLAGAPLNLRCSFARTADAAEEPQLAWEIDGREAGTGTSVWVAGAEPGEHEVTLVIADSHGKSTVKSRFEVLVASDENRQRILETRFRQLGSE